jgi:hypothetical protein
VAANADIAVIIVGYTPADEGEYVPSLNALPPELAALFTPMPEGFVLFEKSRAKKHAAETASAGPSGDGVGGDRASLRLRPIDEQIITAVAAANSRTVVAIVAAGAVITETWRNQVPATLIMWYAGMEGGHALADTTVEITVDISMLALAEWDPTTRQRVQPNLRDVTLEVSSFAHDPSAILVEMVAS